MDTLRKRTLSMVLAGTFLGSIGVLGGCHSKDSVPPGSPSETPPAIMKSAQQNGEARAAWLKTHLDEHGSPIPQSR